MTEYRASVEFRAHSHAMRALVSLYSLIETTTEREPDLSPVVVFMAFSIEAYLNALGATKIAFWEHIERMPWRTKLSILHDVAKVEPDWGKEPLQFAVELFKVRDNLAHGKPETVLGPPYEAEQDAKRWENIRDLRPTWLAKIDRKWIGTAKEKHEALMIYMAELCGTAGLSYQVSAEIETIVREDDA
jgi:hypothetical protein